MQTSQAYTLDKKLYMSWVQQRMELTRTTGLSSNYFSIGDIPGFIASVDDYLNGVYIDPGYLKRLASSNAREYYLPFLYNLKPDQGYTQGKGIDSDKHPSEQDKYDGSVILVNIDALEKPTAFHEAIHVFAFARRLGDLDRDEYKGPEFISGQFVDLLIRLHYLDRDVDNLVRQARSGNDIQQSGLKLVRKINLVEKLFNDGSTPQVMQLLRAMGGKADFRGYRLAVGQKLDAAVAAGNRGMGGNIPRFQPTPTPPAGMRIRDYCPSAPKKLSGSDAFDNEKCPNGIRRYRLEPQR